ncbi:MAG: hypothetical protein J6O40_00010 [Ruminococcus sp.]|nr:hypothetical protein [Ruminococcus sp.]
MLSTQIFRQITRIYRSNTTHNYIDGLKALAGKLLPSSISSTIENEKKQIEKIDAVIKAREALLTK